PPSERAALAEELEALFAALDRLTPGQREVFVLRHLAHGAPRWESIAREVQAPSADAARQLYARAVAAILRARGGSA
ncbi:MAG TPA: RNA polymerase subunit sigma-24, partial [Planctomycetota bacterium]|nr:RNA polymerase subunit sigma-24 [Planctomycetota bacterium]